MHELSIATELLALCERAMDEQQAGPLLQVRIAVGDRSGVEASLLEFAWQAVITDTPHEGARLEIEACFARQTCDDCGEVQERTPGSWLRLCPYCSRPLRVDGGIELDLLDVLCADPAPLVR